MATIAAHIPTYNCPEEFKKCLDAIKWVDEIIVADNSTNDDIKKICDNFFITPLKYYHTEETDTRIRLVNSVTITKSDYIIWVHTDEFYSKEAALEIRKTLSQDETLDGYIIPSQSYLYREYLGEGGSFLRLFRKDSFFFEFKTMHEWPKVKGQTGVLENGYIHYNSPSIDMQVYKVFLYAKNDAKIKTNEELNKLRVDKLSSWKLKMRFIYFFIKLLYRHRKALYTNKFSFVHLWLFYLDTMTLVANSTASTEEIRFREVTNQASDN